ncbi:putative glutaredoxin [Lyophyllum shimeji]|uniref:Glutaredoxin n=1 Tax=Lyophyllum shimeji TaxID=47721 RepID=A0A9P3PL36_LYOSH|nr:putative glutaredoxin [Lyophyllum shimeji]
MSAPVPSAWTPVRRRRFLIFVVALVSFLFCFGVPWELPPSLRDAGLSALSRANIAHLAKSKSQSPPEPKVDEIFGLLHLVTEDVERVLDDVKGLDPTQAINMTVYAGDEKLDWSKTIKKLNKKYPVVVVSKSYCPYSKRAKKLLETYHIQPPPKVIEVDLRTDSDIIKAILGRLTNRYTFPNIIVRGQSIGGSDDLQTLHAQRQLAKILEKAGAVLRDDGSGK